MNTLPEYFGATYLINLPERTDRLASATREFARIGWTLGPGGVQLFPARKFSEQAGFPNAGVRGAFYSHWGCLRSAVAESHRSALILEDDITFSPSLSRLTSSILLQLNAMEWDIVYFGHHETGEIPVADLNTSPTELKFDPCDVAIQGLHFYGVSNRVIPRLIAHLERVAGGVEGDQEFGPMPVDGAINIFRRINPDVRTVAAHPILGWQRPSRSDITPRNLDRLHVLRPLTSALRELKHRAKHWLS